MFAVCVCVCVFVCLFVVMLSLNKARFCGHDSTLAASKIKHITNALEVLCIGITELLEPIHHLGDCLLAVALVVAGTNVNSVGKNLLLAAAKNEVVLRELRVSDFFCQGYRCYRQHRRGSPQRGTHRGFCERNPRWP